jgi:hypothetical protein
MSVAGRLDIAGKFNTARGALAPQLGQATGKSYSASGRKSENEPQRGQSYSYLGMLSLDVCWQGSFGAHSGRDYVDFRFSRPASHIRLRVHAGKDAFSDTGVDAPVAINDLGYAEIDSD